VGPAPGSTRIEVSPGEHVTAVTYAAADRDRPGASIILAHGAGAGQASDFMVRFASALAARGIDAITFNFVYTQEGRRAPDRNDKLEACYRKVIEAFRDGALGDVGRKLVIGGKSMGGRIASQVAAGPAGGAADLVAGLVFLGYPLHPPGRPAQLRTRHWPKIRAPMLFVQGTRDAFGTADELQRHFAALHAPVELYAVEGGDHSLKVLKNAGIPQQAVYDAALDKIADWLRQL
jgi:uncharacterized protein